MQQSLFALLAGQDTAAPTAGFDPNQPLRDTVVTVIDLETTGLNAKKNAITEVTAIQFRNGTELKKFSTLVQPTDEITDEVFAITGINADMVRNAPPIMTVLSDLTRFFETEPLIVGHNVSFDIGFLREKLSQNGLSAFQNRLDLTRSLCTRILAKKLLPGLPGYEGVVVATACGVVNPNPHRAENDVRMSAAILFHLYDKLEAQGVKTIGDALAFQGPLSER
jgi:DNA polymerase III epsilon subunit family exonuclease